MDLNRVLYISQEITPYVPAREISSFCKDLPEGILSKGSEVRTFMPRYGIINERRNQLHEVIRLSGLNIVIDDTDHPLIIKVATMQPSRMQVYFIDNDDYFVRHSAKGLETETHVDENDERSIFFVRGVLETVRKLRWAPAVIHCTGWIAALTPLYLRKRYGEDPVFANTKIVYSLFDNPFEVDFDSRFPEKLLLDGFSEDDLAPLNGSADHNAISRMAIAHADAVTVASENIPEELVEYARSLGKPVLEYKPELNHQDYRDFYLSL